MDTLVDYILQLLVTWDCLADDLLYLPDDLPLAKANELKLMLLRGFLSQQERLVSHVAELVGLEYSSVSFDALAVFVFFKTFG